MIISDPNSYYHAQKDPRWKAGMGQRDELCSEKHYLGTSFSSSGEKIGSMQVGVSD